MSNLEKNVSTEKNESTATTHEVKGSLTYENKVIQKIIGLALEKVPGLLDVDGGFFSNLTEKIINTDNVTRGVNVEYKINVPELYNKIKEVVTSEVSQMTNLEVVEVNVNVVDIKTKEQFEADSVSLQDRVTDAAESTGEFASEQFEKVKTGFSSGVSTAKEKASEGVEAVKDVTSKEKSRVN